MSNDLDFEKYLDLHEQTSHNSIKLNVHAEKYDHDFNSAHKYMYASIPKCNDNTFLDIGCAGGYGLYKMRERGFKVRGLSIMDKDIENLKQYGMEGDVSDMHNMPYEDGKFSHILASHVIEHSPAPYVALKEMYRVLKNPGYLTVVLPPWDGAANNFPITDYQYHIFCVPHQGIKIMLKKAGFTLIKYEEVPQYVKRDGKRLIDYHHEFYLAYKGTL